MNKIRNNLVEILKDTVAIHDIVTRLGGLSLKQNGMSLQGNCLTRHDSKGEQ